MWQAGAVKIYVVHKWLRIRVKYVCTYQLCQKSTVPKVITSMYVEQAG